MAKEIIQIGHNINGYHFGRCSLLSWKPQSTSCIKFNKQSKNNTKREQRPFLLVYFSLSPFLMGFLLNSFVNFVFFLVMTLAGHRRKSLSSCVSPFMLCLVELFFLACYQFLFKYLSICPNLRCSFITMDKMNFFLT
jgi:hypothetical protein